MSLITSNQSLLDPQLFTSKVPVPQYLFCYISEASSFVYSSFLITNISILFLLCVFILHHGHQQLRGSSSSLSPSDCLTYHLTTMELIGLSGCAVGCGGIYCTNLNLLAVGNFIFDFAWFGEILFHVLTCVERYLAVVHPLTYRNLRNKKGVRIRNASIVCVWLCCFVVIGLEMIKVFPIINICFLVSFLTIVSFSTRGVLCVLIHPGPGEAGEGRARVDLTKRRAFHTINAILGVLVVKLSVNIVWESVFYSKLDQGCLIISCFSWINLPCSLVLPLLFLHRAGKLVCHKRGVKM